MKKTQITVEGTAISVLESDYISLTDIARHFDQEDPRELINNWMRLKDTVELIGAWEVLHNPNFKCVEFDTIKNQAGSNRFRLSPTKYLEAYNEVLISHAVPKFERHQELRRTAGRQLAALYAMNRLPFEAIQSPLQLAAPQAPTSDLET